MCAAPAHGSLVTKASPSLKPIDAPNRAIIIFTAALRQSDSRVIKMPMNRLSPSGVSKALLKSLASYTTGEPDSSNATRACSSLIVK